MTDISTIYEAIRAGEYNTVETYVTTLTSINNQKLKVIDSLLAYAVREDQLEIVKLLVTHSANPEVTNNWLMKYAFDNGKSAMIDYLSTGK